MPADGTKNLKPFSKGDPLINRKGRPKGSVSVKMAMKRFMAMPTEVLGLPDSLKKIELKNICEAVAAQVIHMFFEKGTSKDVKIKIAQYLADVIDPPKQDINIKYEEINDNELQEHLDKLPLEKLLEIEKIIKSGNGNPETPENTT